MSTRTVTLTDHLNRFLDEGITSGRFTNASEAVQEALSLLEERQTEEDAKLKWLRNAADEGFRQIDRGEGIKFESMDDLGAYLDRVGEEVESGQVTEPHVA